jgi:DNA polymerase V
VPVPRESHPGGGCVGSPIGSVVAPALDLARALIRDPERSLLLRVCGDSMLGAGIRPGALLVVERQARAAAGAIVVVRLGERFTLKRLRRSQGRCWLEAAHPAYPPLDLEAMACRLGLTPEDVQLWGVAVHVIHTL